MNPIDVLNNIQIANPASIREMRYAIQAVSELVEAARYVVENNDEYFQGRVGLCLKLAAFQTGEVGDGR